MPGAWGPAAELGFLQAAAKGHFLSVRWGWLSGEREAVFGIKWRLSRQGR